jgi:protein-tyrosine kinase
MGKAKTKSRPAGVRIPDPSAAEEQRLPSYPLAVSSAEMGHVAEAVRALRTRLQTQHLHAGRRGLVVCGASPEVGSSFVAANLATAMSQIGVKTLLVDADLRNPTIHRYFGLDLGGGGLAAALQSFARSPSEFVHESVLPNLDVLVAGVTHGWQYELLASDSFPEVMNACLRDYDLTIVDAPPANSCADALRISNVIGFSLIVARRNRSLVSDVRLLIEQLKNERVRVVGTVLNDY